MVDRPPARFESFRGRAAQIIRSPEQVQSLLGQATRKLASASGERWRTLVEQLKLSIALIRAWASGDYREVSNKTVIVLIAALLYFVVPMDVIPDFLFAWGLLDDAAVIAYVFAQVSEELEAFKRWQTPIDEEDQTHAEDH